MTRPLRKDAAERRAAVLEAARAVFAEQGIDAPLDNIAARAQVGRATLYRNFPGRTEIALAVLIDEIVGLKRRFAECAAPAAFLEFLGELSERLERNAALGGVLAAAASQELLQPLRQAIIEAGSAPLKVSQAAGLVRADLQPGDVRVLAAMLGAGLQGVAAAERRAVAARSRQFVLDAVRARG